MNLYYGGLENAQSNFMPLGMNGNGWGIPSQHVRIMPISRMTGSGKKRKQKGGAVTRAFPSVRATPTFKFTPMPVVKAAPKSMFERAKDYLKQHKIVSRGLNFGAELLDKTKDYAHLGGLARGASAFAAQHGYGKSGLPTKGKRKAPKKRKATKKRKARK